MVTINFLLTKEDYFNFYYYISWLAPGKKAAFIKTRVKFFAYFTFLLFLVKFSAPVSNIDTYFIVSILILACIYILPVFTIKTDTRKQAFAFTENPLNINLFTKTETVISDTGIFSTDISVEVKYGWDCIIKKEETNDYYFLYINTLQAIIIPKRALTSEADKLKLVQLFGQHIPFNAEVGHLVKN